MASVTEPTRTEPTRTERVIPVKPSNVNCTTIDTHPSEIKPTSYSPIQIESGTDLPVTHEHTSEDSVARRLVILGTVLFPLAGLIAAIIIAFAIWNGALDRHCHACRGLVPHRDGYHDWLPPHAHPSIF